MVEAQQQEFYKRIPDALTFLWAMQEAQRHIRRLIEMPDNEDRKINAMAFTETRLAEAIERAVIMANVTVDQEIKYPFSDPRNSDH